MYSLKRTKGKTLQYLRKVFPKVQKQLKLFYGMVMEGVNAIFSVSFTFGIVMPNNKVLKLR